MIFQPFVWPCIGIKYSSVSVIAIAYETPILRELPEIARQFVIRILFVEQPVPQAVISSWSSQVYAK